MGLKLTLEGATIADLRDQIAEVGGALGLGAEPFMAGDETADAAPPIVPATVATTPGVGIVPATVAPVAPVVPAAVAPAAVAPAAVAGGEVLDMERDAENLPYDARIHTEARTRNKDGRWRIKRNTDAALVAQVKAELLATPVPAVGITGEAVAAVAADVPAPPPPIPGAAVVPPVVVPTTAALVDITTTIQLASRILASGKTPAEIGGLAARVQAIFVENELPGGSSDLLNRPDKAVAVHGSLTVMATELGVPTC